MTDLLLDNNPDGSDFVIDGGDLVINESVQNAVYLTLLGTELRQEAWFADNYKDLASQKATGAFQKLLFFIPITNKNLLRLEDAAIADLQWLIDQELILSASINITLSGLNTINVFIEIVNKFESIELFSFEIKRFLRG